MAEQFKVIAKYQTIKEVMFCNTWSYTCLLRWIVNVSCGWEIRCIFKWIWYSLDSLDLRSISWVHITRMSGATPCLLALNCDSRSIPNRGSERRKRAFMMIRWITARSDQNVGMMIIMDKISQVQLCHSICDKSRRPQNLRNDFVLISIPCRACTEESREQNCLTQKSRALSRHKEE